MLTYSRLPLLILASASALASCVLQNTPEPGQAAETPHFEYHENGRPRLHGHLRGGLRTGTWRAWREDGKITWQATYHAGQLHGHYIAWRFPHKTMEGRYRKGRRNGLWVTWSIGGKLRSEGHYENGLPSGRWIYYHANGRKSATGVMRDGRRHGKWTFWNEDGSLDRKQSGTYKNGRRVDTN